MILLHKKRSLQKKKSDPMSESRLVSINISSGGIPKVPVASVFVSFAGLAGDAHNHEKHRTPLQAVCLQDVEKLRDLAAEGFSLASGTTGENFTVENLFVNQLPIGSVLEFEQGLVLEITKIRKPCYVLDSIDSKLQESIVGRCGMYARVLKEGFVSVGEILRVNSTLPKLDFIFIPAMS